MWTYWSEDGELQGNAYILVCRDFQRFALELDSDNLQCLHLKSKLIPVVPHKAVAEVSKIGNL